MSVNKQKQLENVKRQGKRFASLLDIPLNDAQFLLAKHIYQENSFKDIKAKIRAGKVTERIFLASVDPESEDINTYFLGTFGDLLLSVGNSPIAALYPGSARDLLMKTFCLSEEKFED